MIDLEPMWLALAKYQPYADADGHGESWRKMCERRLEDDAYAAGAVAKVGVCMTPAFAAIAAQHAEAGEEAKKQALIVNKALADYNAAGNQSQKAKQAAAMCMEAVAAFHSAEVDDLEIADYWFSKVIDRIEAAIKEREHVSS